MLLRLMAEHLQLSIDGTRNVWVVKPGHGSRGRGVKCFDDLQAILQHAASRKRACIVQKYVEPCLLLDEKKFDIRAWVLVTSWNPLTVWMYEPYIRLCTEKHSLESTTLHNQFAHLCNRCVQEEAEEYDDEDEETGTMWSVETLTQYLDKTSGGHGKDIWDKIRAQCLQIAHYTTHCVQETVHNQPGCFEWFGLDFLVDQEHNVWNLECNISPDLSRGTEVLERLVPEAMTELWEMILEPHDASLDRAEHGWDLVFRGKEIPREALQKRFCMKKNLNTELRAGRPFSLRDALQSKAGPFLNALLAKPGEKRVGGKGSSTV